MANLSLPKQFTMNMTDDTIATLTKLTKAPIVINWGDKETATWNAEHGFWMASMHLDKRLYQHSCLNKPEVLKLIMEYKPPMDIHEVLSSSPFSLQAKYPQEPTSRRWDGIVLITQNPNDLSVRMVGKPEDHIAFVEAACAKWRDQLFLKLHPKNTLRKNDDMWKLLAAKYGCEVGNVDHGIIEHCRFVVLYNSTYVIDALLRGKNVMQYAPGYFYKTGAVTFTNGMLPDSVEDRIDIGNRLLNWCIWRYCFPCKEVSQELWIKALTPWIDQRDPIPILPEECSYAANVNIPISWYKNNIFTDS